MGSERGRCPEVLKVIQEDQVVGVILASARYGSGGVGLGGELVTWLERTVIEGEGVVVVIIAVRGRYMGHTYGMDMVLVVNPKSL